MRTTFKRVRRFVILALASATIASVGVVTTAAPASAQTALVCGSGAIPAGWAITDYPLTIFNCPAGLGFEIQRFRNRSEGTFISICSLQPNQNHIPGNEGYVIVSATWDPTRCGDPFGFVMNVVTVKLPHPNDNSGLTVCRVSSWFNDWIAKDLGVSTLDNCTATGPGVISRSRILIRHSVLSVGSIISVCNQTIPAGWQLVTRETNPGRCNEFGGPASNNVMVIRKTNGEPLELDYVALGDSFTSGQGSPPYTNRACRSSSSAWPRSLAAETSRRRTIDFSLQACGFSSTAHVLSTQLSALRNETEVVTVTVGAHDIGLVDRFLSCVMPGPECTGMTLGADRGVLENKLRAVYTEVKRLSEAADLLVIGYPKLFPRTRLTGCPATLSQNELTAIDGLWNEVNTVIRTIAQEVRVDYVDYSGLFDGHSVCAPEGQRWANGLLLNAGYMGSFLPNAEGERQIALALERDGHFPVRRY